MDDAAILIDAQLVRNLVGSQFPGWRDLPIAEVANPGWDNRTFRLGPRLLVRLPTADVYAAQVDKEQCWLPRLAPLLPIAIPAPVALGQPACGYPWKWSIYDWIEGEVASAGRICDLPGFARAIAGFLDALEGIDATDGPRPGAHNFHRGGSIATYDDETRRAIDVLRDEIDGATAAGIWERALATTWKGAPVWVHGDLSAGNLLVRDGILCGVIDFGMLAVGDPACDLAIAWTFLDSKSRDAFCASLPVDPATWQRGRGWALWKSLIVAAGLAPTNAMRPAEALRTIEEIVACP